MCEHVALQNYRNAVVVNKSIYKYARKPSCIMIYLTNEYLMASVETLFAPVKVDVPCSKPS
jgi:hypothetical protein